MPTTPLPDDILAFLGLPNPAVMASVREDGQPVTVATWYLMDGADVLVNLDAGRARLAYLRAEPRVSLTVLDGADWYSHISVQGKVQRIVDDEDLADIDRISTHYTGHAYRVRDRRRVSVWCSVERWHRWGRFAT